MLFQSEIFKSRQLSHSYRSSGWFGGPEFAIFYYFFFQLKITKINVQQNEFIYGFFHGIFNIDFI